MRACSTAILAVGPLGILPVALTLPGSAPVSDFVSHGSTQMDTDVLESGKKEMMKWNPGSFVLAFIIKLTRPLPAVSAVPSGLGPGNSCAEDSARYSWRLIQTPYSFTL